MFEALVETAPDAMVAVDAGGRIVLANAQAGLLFGYHRSEMIGQHVEMLVPDGARSLHPRRRAAYAANPTTRSMGAGTELAARRKDGSEFPAEISLSSIQTADGVLVSAAVRDVTERKRAEAKFRGLLEAAPDAIIGVDSSGRIALVNAQAERLFGYARDELVGELVDLLVPDAVRGVHPAKRDSYFTDPFPRPMGAGMQLAGRRKDGTEFPAEISLSSIETEDGVLVSAAVRDVTERLEAQAERERLRAAAERERIEAQLQQSQRLESLGQLAGGVAHDFNNLLAAILNFSAFVAEELGVLASEGHAERYDQILDDVGQISRAADRATELTHQLLAFGRREVVAPRVLDLNHVVVEVEQLLHRTIGEHVELVTSLGDDLWRIRADPGQLGQVLMNLAVNGRDAMPGGGILTIETGNLFVDDAYAAGMPGLLAGRHVRIAVSDTGQGMSKDVKERAFEPFFSTKPKGEGTGLGLATVYGIVTQAEGHAHIYSEPGFGTTITALFPATDEHALEPEARTRGVHARGGETILVVEDEALLRTVTERILNRNSYRVLLAATGADALELVEKYDGTIHLLLSDVVMPQMLGKEVASRISELRPGIKVLYMSGYAQPVLASQGTLDPGVVLLGKPFTESELLSKLREVLDS